MIDMHSHILPGIDDGPESLQQSLRMARQALEAGVSIMAATPHARDSDFAALLPARDAALAKLRQALRQEKLPLRIFSALEILLRENSLARLQEQAGCFYAPEDGSPLSRRVLLLELPLDTDLGLCQELLFQAQLKNMQVILAHPERYLHFSSRVKLLQELMERGLVLQFNASSLRGGLANWPLTRAMLALIKHSPQQIVLGSDAHDCTRRAPGLLSAKPLILRKFGEALWWQLARNNAAALLGEDEGGHEEPQSDTKAD
ncbi:MAG: CpsB/CapC family capsule biosynthesis tyrosine phosphatase [Lentisphaeria bacterium]|jgi:protein-tyrosine phosphatase|nr:CpsB/CapC family capsule biosynthesis tyrosine phosphatase [Lentisphaeria bacterium]